MLHLLQMGPSKVLTTLSLQIQSSWQLSLSELPPPPYHNTVTPSLDSSDMYTSTVQSGTPSTDAALLPQPHLQISYPSSAHSISPSSAPSPPSLAPGSPSTPPALTLSRLFNGMLEVFEPGALNYFHFLSSHPVDLICIQESNLNSSSSFRIPDSLLCFLIAPTPGLAFSLLMPRMLAAALSFSSGTAYPFLNFPPRLFLHSIPTLIM